MMFAFMFKDSIKEYESIEADLVEAADFYITKNNIKVGNELIITSDQLLESKFVNSMKTSDDECVGYVVIQTKKTEKKYKSYIKCSNYITEGFENVKK